MTLCTSALSLLIPAVLSAQTLTGVIDIHAHHAPDSVPRHHPEIKKIWDRLNALVEKRGEKPGIDIDEMDIVTGATRPKKAKP